MISEAKKQAILDIQEELIKTSKSFIAFRKDLNGPIRKLVSNYLKQQKAL